ncbi:hypothetical protein DBR11_21010 [Pedobacter sp. HMWF019]|uniref:DUF456 domain-containing protein n=1 Tax=Pedobacter sp. HMWF019 TaxID=2056856 RepID=UPI000D3AECE0|nr:DUF456 domain-containing protein [Pedobacter sp. HMWF019]PTS95661.1 hypothetical protein DBR11_21010 [Pedobacter sp. HMWF019]
MLDKKIRNTAIVVAVLMLVGVVINFFVGGYRTWPWFDKFDATATGQFGDFIGGVIGTVINAFAFYFLYLTLTEQKKATEEQKTATDNQRIATYDQRKAFELERFESKFFELVKFPSR